METPTISMTPAKSPSKNVKSPRRPFREKEEAKKKDTPPPFPSPYSPQEVTVAATFSAEMSETAAVEAREVVEVCAEKFQHMNDKGIETTTFTLRSEGQLDGMSITLKRFDTYPIEFQVEFTVEAQQQLWLEKHLQALNEGFIVHAPEFNVKCLPPVLNHPLRSKATADQGNDKESKDQHEQH